MKHLFFFFTSVVILLSCVSGQSCLFSGTFNVNKTLISCSAINDGTISLGGQGIVFLNADAFKNNTELTNL